MTLSDLLLFLCILALPTWFGYRLGVSFERDRWRFRPKHRRKWLAFGSIPDAPDTARPGENL